MKKLVLVAMIMLLVPFTSFALDTMTDADLDEMTAQAGVQIALSIMVESSATDAAWGNTSGGSTSWLVLDGEETNTTQRIMGVVDIEVMQVSTSTAGDIGALLTTYDPTATADTTAVVINLNIDTINTGGGVQTIKLGTTADAENNVVDPITGLDAGANTLGSYYSGVASQNDISGVIVIMAK